jgi:hypothetical protein
MPINNAISVCSQRLNSLNSPIIKFVHAHVARGHISRRRPLWRHTVMVSGTHGAVGPVSQIKPHTYLAYLPDFVAPAVIVVQAEKTIKRVSSFSLSLKASVPAAHTPNVRQTCLLHFDCNMCEQNRVLSALYSVRFAFLYGQTILCRYANAFCDLS